MLRVIIVFQHRENFFFVFEGEKKSFKNPWNDEQESSEPSFKTFPIQKNKLDRFQALPDEKAYPKTPPI